MPAGGEGYWSADYWNVNYWNTNYWAGASAGSGTPFVLPGTISGVGLVGINTKHAPPEAIKMIFFLIYVFSW